MAANGLKTRKQMIQPQTDSKLKAAFPDARILVVDDERSMRRTLTDTFQRMGYQTQSASSGQQALEYLADRHFDLVILDLKMPGMSGTEVLEQGHSLSPDTVFIILTAHGTLDSAISGIRHGAFDYLLKPSPVKEIIDAVEAGLSHQKQMTQSEDPITMLEQALTNLKASRKQPDTPPATDRFLQAADITVDIHKHLVVVHGQQIDLTPTEFDLLIYFMRHPNRVISCREIVAGTRDKELNEQDASLLIRTHIHRLRQKIEPDPSNPSLLRTVRGRGYIFATESNLP